MTRRLPRAGDPHDYDYRTCHQSDGYGAHYNKTYQTGYYAALWAKIERPLLEKILKRVGGRDRSCLDFACGTGRILSVSAGLFGTAVGVDVSEAMLACVQPRANVELFLVDLTRQHLDRTFDVATAFRFFLNAQDSLRREALRSIHQHLRPDGVLICDIHMTSTSPAGLFYRLVNVLTGRTVAHTASPAAFARLLRASGFSIEAVHAYGYLPRPGHFLPRLCEALIQPVETLCRTLRAPAWLAQHVIVVARKPSSAETA